MHDPDWSSLRHAYGAATDVPAMLARVASGDPEQHAEGLTELLAAICHQGTAYSATLPAIPPLCAVLRTLPPGARAPLLSALGDISTAGGEEVGNDALRDALAAELDAFRAVLTDGTSSERALALVVVAAPAFRSIAPQVLALASDRDEEPVVRARAWETLREVAPEELPDRVEDLAAVRLVAGVARLSIAGPGADRALIDQVAADLADRATASQVEEWSYGSAFRPTWSPCGAHLAAHAPLRRALAQRLMDQTDMVLATEHAEVMLGALFPSGQPVDLAALTPAQREALVALAESDGAFLGPGQINGNLMSLLARRGLPSGFDAREELLARLDVLPVARVMVVTPRASRGARARCEALGREAWLDVPFVLMRNAPDFSEAIPEDPDDFPESVMNDYVDIVRALQATVQRYTMPADNGGFYPSLSVEGFIEVARSLGCEVVEPNLTHADDRYDPAEWTAEDPFFPGG